MNRKAFTISLIAALRGPVAVVVIGLLREPIGYLTSGIAARISEERGPASISLADPDG